MRFQHKSFRTYQDEWSWEQRTLCSLGDGNDASRADVLTYAVWTWPSDTKVRAWLEDWEKWEAEKPSW